MLHLKFRYLRRQRNLKKGEDLIGAEVFLQDQIWIVNYYVINPIKNSQQLKEKTGVFRNSLFWHFNSRFVLKATETPVLCFHY